VDDAESHAALEKAVDCGVNFIDTADVYGMGRSERLIAQLKRERKEEIVVATKAGRRLQPHTAGGYNLKNLTAFVEDSLRNLGNRLPRPGAIALPAHRVYYTAERSAALDRLVGGGQDPVLRSERGARRGSAGKLSSFPMSGPCRSSSTVSATGPRLVLRASQEEAGLGFWRGSPWRAACSPASSRAIRSSPPTIIATSTRHGEAFDVGETFSGVDYETALEAVEEIRQLLPPGVSMAQFRAALDSDVDAVTCRHSSAKRPSQVAGQLRRHRTCRRYRMEPWKPSAESTTQRFARACISGGEGRQLTDIPGI